MRHLLRGYRSGTDVPLALRVSTRIALAYLISQFLWDEPRMRSLFGAASLWSRPVNHPLVVFRCVEALSELLRRSVLAANGSEWLGACVAPLTERERRAILLSAATGRTLSRRSRDRVVRQITWLAGDVLSRWRSLLERPDTAQAGIRDLLFRIANRAIDDIDRELANHVRQRQREIDPSALAGAIGTVALGSTETALPNVTDPIKLLLDQLDQHGTWAAGRPFAYDDLGSASYATSIEIAVLVLKGTRALDRPRPRLATDLLYDRVQDHLSRVYAWLEGSRLTIQLPRTRRRDGANLTTSGWSSDRAPGFERIDG